MLKIFYKFKKEWLYIFYGILTTLINIIFYYLFYEILDFTNVISNFIAWILAVNFAFITNKLFVFRSRNSSKTIVIKEMRVFFILRISTGIIDIIFMYITVDLFLFNSIIMKLIASAIVIVLNYFGSKLFVFVN